MCGSKVAQKEEEAIFPKALAEPFALGLNLEEQIEACQVERHSRRGTASAYSQGGRKQECLGAFRVTYRCDGG